MAGHERVSLHCSHFLVSCACTASRALSAGSHDHGWTLVVRPQMNAGLKRSAIGNDILQAAAFDKAMHMQRTTGQRTYLRERAAEGAVNAISSGVWHTHTHIHTHMHARTMARSH